MRSEDFHDEPDAGVEPLAGQDENTGVDPIDADEDDVALEEFEEEWEEHWQEGPEDED
jgi:hypothetical protein